MKYRRYRWANIAAIGVALTVAVASVWYREKFGPNTAASLGGVVSLLFIIVFQAVYDAQSELANAAIHARITGESDRAHARIDVLQARLDEIEADRTPPHGTPIIRLQEDSR